MKFMFVLYNVDMHETSKLGGSNRTLTQFFEYEQQQKKAL